MEPDFRPDRPLNIHLIRHAESEANVKAGHFGIEDPPLTAQGRKQAMLLGKYLYRCRIPSDFCISSDYQRARETAEIMLMGMLVKEPHVPTDPRLREIDRGIWTGQPFEVATDDPETLRRFRGGDIDFAPKGGESMRTVGERMLEAFNEVAKCLALSAGNTALIVSHGRAIGAFHLLFSQCRPELGWRYVIDNTSITTIEYHLRDGWRVKRMNATPHLAL